jgi:hypothetical protein
MLDAVMWRVVTLVRAAGVHREALLVCFVTVVAAIAVMLVGQGR